MRFLSLIFTFTVTFAFGQIERIEPPFWWADMNNDSLQLLIYGKSVADYSPKSNDLLITHVDAVENNNYLIVNLNLEGQSPGAFKIELEAKGKKTLSFDYELKKRIANSAQRKGYDSSDLLYLIMPDRFANGDPSNDTVKGFGEGTDREGPWSRHGGDLKGISDHLDYIESLGATGVWNTPICETNSPHKYGSYHGYAQTNLYKIDPRLGTNEDYVALSKSLKKRNMKLVKDYVINHWSDNHWMMQDLPDANWANTWDSMTYAKHSKEIFSDPYGSEIDLKYVTEGWFDNHMMDLNITAPLFLKYLIQNAIWWVEYADLDGLRVDTYPYNDKDAITEWATAIYKEYPNFSIVAEAWLMSPVHLSYWQKDSPVAAMTGFNSQVNVVKDFALYAAMMNAFKPDHSWEEGVRGLHYALQFDFLYNDVNDLLTFAENHDTQRINTAYPKFEDYKLVMTLLATLRGIPQLYYGSEIGMKGDKAKGDGDIRRDFPGGWEEDSQNAFLGEQRTERQQRYFDFSSKLFNWRKSAAVVHRGKMMHFIPEEDVYVYFRSLDTEKIMVVINANKEKQTLKMERFAEAVKEHTSGVDVLTNERYSLDSNLEVAPRTAYIINLK